MAAVAGKPRTTRAMRNYRLHVLLQLHKRGYNVVELEKYCVENFEISQRRAQELVEDLLSLEVAMLSPFDTQRYAATLHLRYEHALKEAMRRGQWETVRGILDSLARFFYLPLVAFAEADAAQRPPATGDDEPDDGDESEAEAESGQDDSA